MADIYDSACRRCSLSDRPHRKGLHVCVPASGPDDADIIFFGEAPGADEERATPPEPFVGRAGGELDGLLERVKLNRRTVRVSNAVRCRPDGNRKPTQTEVEACAYYTVRELAAVRPRVIVALGGSALKALTGQSEVGRNRGKLLPLLPVYRSDARVIATYHPAAYLHNPANRRPYRLAITEDLRLAKKVAKGAALEASVVTPFDGPEAMAAALDRLATVKRLACDLEWEVLPARGETPEGRWPWSRRRGRAPRATAVGIAGRVDGELVAVSVPLLAGSAGGSQRRGYVRAVRRLLARTPSYYHHAMADLIWLAALGWRVRLRGCTLILASLLGIEGSRSLAALAGRLTKMPADWKGETEESIGTAPATEGGWRALLARNGRDTVATVLVLEAEERLVKRRKREAVLPLYRKVILPSIGILAGAAVAGVPVDEKLLHETYVEDEDTVRRLTRKVGRLLEIDGDVEHVVANSALLGPYLERATGATLPRQPKKNETSVTKDVLAQLRDLHPAVAVEQQRRKAQSRINNNWRPWTLLLREQGDARLHTVFKHDVARTGRTSAESEAGHTFQQFPRGGAYRRHVRARKGWLIGNVDQSQIELRIIAWLANERRMLDFFRRGEDLHTAIAGFMKAQGEGWTLRRYLKDRQRWMRDVTDDERYGAKPINFGLGFVGGPSVVQRTARQDYGLTMTDAQAQLGYDSYHSFYPDIKPWHESCWRYVEQGWVETPTGRRRELVFTEGEDAEDRLRKAVNTPVQNFASDLSLSCTDYTTELLIAEYGRHLPDFFEVIGFFHDAEQFHFDRRERSAIEEIVARAWEHPPLERLGIEFPVPLKAEIKIGRRWKG